MVILKHLSFRQLINRGSLLVSCSGYKGAVLCGYSKNTSFGQLINFTSLVVSCSG